jgi:hypothetical protein
VHRPQEQPGWRVPRLVFDPETQREEQAVSLSYYINGANQGRPLYTDDLGRPGGQLLVSSQVPPSRIEQHKRITSQLIKDHGLKLTERDHFRNYASYVLKQGSLSEQDDFIRGLNIPLFVENKKIFRRFES